VSWWRRQHRKKLMKMWIRCCCGVSSSWRICCIFQRQLAPGHGAVEAVFDAGSSEASKTAITTQDDIVWKHRYEQTKQLYIDDVMNKLLPLNDQYKVDQGSNWKPEDTALRLLFQLEDLLKPHLPQKHMVTKWEILHSLILMKLCITGFPQKLSTKDDQSGNLN
jgi:hypothetical protein